MKYTMLLPLALLTACSTIDSKDLKTTGIQADFSVEGKADGTSVVSASFKTSSTGYVDLSSGDRVEITSGSEKGSITKTNLLGVISYSSSFSGSEEGKAFKIAFLRDNDVSAPESTATLPKRPSVTSPATNEKYVFNQTPIVVKWDGGNASDSVTITLRGPCLFDEVIKTNDSGSYTFNAGTLRPVESFTGASCNATLSVARQKTGSVDSAYGKGGSFIAKATSNIVSFAFLQQ